MAGLKSCASKVVREMCEKEQKVVREMCEKGLNKDSSGWGFAA